nr:uncharacterized protein LOC109160652 [Ipomoea batatas]
MSLLTWNCRGLGNPTTIQVLADLIRAKRPKVVFLIETFMTKQRMEPIRARVGFQNMFVVDACGHRGGLVLLWHEAVETRRRRNKIKQLKNADGEVVESIEEMGHVMTEYFTTLFTASNCEMEDVLKCITGCLKPKENNRLLGVVSAEEVRRAVFEMHPDKSPGPDGLGSGPGVLSALLGYCGARCNDVLSKVCENDKTSYGS